MLNKKTKRKFKRNAFIVKQRLSLKQSFEWHKFVLAMSVVFFIASLFLQIYMSNQLAIKGKALVNLQNSKKTLSKEISELKLEQSKYSSISYIEQRAIALGFQENTLYAIPIKPVTATASLSTF